MTKKFLLIFLGIINYFILFPLKCILLIGIITTLIVSIYYNKLTMNYHDSFQKQYTAFKDYADYAEYYYDEEAIEKFQLNKMYSSVTKEDFDFLKKQIRIHKKLINAYDSNILWYSFKEETQLNENDLIYQEYNHDYSFKIYYLDIDKKTLYYFGCNA